jgi:hypothetical protein
MLDPTRKKIPRSVVGDRPPPRVVIRPYGIGPAVGGLGLAQDFSDIGRICCATLHKPMLGRRNHDAGSTYALAREVARRPNPHKDEFDRAVHVSLNSSAQICWMPTGRDLQWFHAPILGDVLLRYHVGT